MPCPWWTCSIARIAHKMMELRIPVGMTHIQLHFLAQHMSHLLDEFFGTVKFCFQPAEEASDGGAEAMVHDGVLQDPKVDFAIGMHVSSAKPVGYVAIEPGPITAYPDFFSITFRGKGGHGSCPSKANAPILPLVATYQMIQNI